MNLRHHSLTVSHISRVRINYVIGTGMVSTNRENCSKNSCKCHQPAWRVKKQKCQRRRGYSGPLGGTRGEKAAPAAMWR